MFSLAFLCVLCVECLTLLLEGSKRGRNLSPQQLQPERCVSGPCTPCDLSTHKSYEGALFVAELRRFDSAAETSQAGPSPPGSRAIHCGNEVNRWLRNFRRETGSKEKSWNCNWAASWDT